MRVVVAVVGKPRNAALATAIADYETRAARYWPLDIHEVREERASSLTPALVKNREAARLSERTGSAHLVACSAGGRQFTSEQFAGWLQRERERERDVAFIIGGAFGLAESLVAASAMKLSLAPWTLPHELARLVLAEQLYRAGTILRDEPYHK